MEHNLTEFLSEKNIFFLKFKSKTKEKLLKEIIKQIDFGKNEKLRKEVIKNILKREKISSTAIGNNLAIPHCYCKNLNKIIIALAILPKSIKIKAKDKTIVKLFVIIIGDEKKKEEYLTVLSKITTLFKDKEFFNAIINFSTPEEVIRFFKTYEEIPKNLEGDLKHLFWIQKLDSQIKAYNEERKFVSDKNEIEIIDMIIKSSEETQKKIESKINRRILEMFKNIQAKYNGIGIVKIINDTCSGCNTLLPVAIINAVKQYNKVVQCENCGRILF